MYSAFLTSIKKYQDGIITAASGGIASIAPTFNRYVAALRADSVASSAAKAAEKQRMEDTLGPDDAGAAVGEDVGATVGEEVGTEATLETILEIGLVIAL